MKESTSLPQRNSFPEKENERIVKQKKNMYNLILISSAISITLVATIGIFLSSYYLAFLVSKENAISVGISIITSCSNIFSKHYNALPTFVEQFGSLIAGLDLPPMENASMTIEFINKTFFHYITSHTVVPSFVDGLHLLFLFPRISQDKIPPQSYEKQSGCYGICSRPGDPLYTGVAGIGAFSEGYAREKNDVLNTYLSINETHYAINSLNHDSNDNYIKYHVGDLLYVTTPLTLYENGTFYDGQFIPFTTWKSANRPAFFYTGFGKLFWLNVNQSILIYAHTSKIICIDFNNILGFYTDMAYILSDENVNIIAYSGNNFNDTRLLECRSNIIDKFNATLKYAYICPSFSAFDHPDSFVKTLFIQKKDFIMKERMPYSSEVDSFSNQNEKFIIISGDSLFSKSKTLRMIVTIAISENYIRKNIFFFNNPLIFCIALLILCTVVLTAVDIIALRDAQRTINYVYKLSQCIALYDIDKAIRVQKEFKGKSCNEALEAQFKMIIDNLQLYKPFLPTSLLKINEEEASDILNLSNVSNNTFSLFNSKNISLDSFLTSISDKSFENSINERRNTRYSLDRISSKEFKRIRGTVLFVQLYNRDYYFLRKIDNKYLTKTIEIVEKYGGIVDVLQANHVLASFNYHLPLVKHEDAACCCSIEIRNTFLAKDNNVSATVAITSGYNFVGVCGNEKQKARLVSGEYVDLAWKLVKLQPIIGVGIVVTENVADKTSLACVPLDIIQPRWWQERRRQTFQVFELYPILKNEMTSELMQITEGFRILRSKGPGPAFEIFSKISNSFHGMRMAKLCNHLIILNMSPYRRREYNWELFENDQFLVHISTSFPDSFMFLFKSLSLCNDSFSTLSSNSAAALLVKKFNNSDIFSKESKDSESRYLSINTPVNSCSVMFVSESRQKYHLSDRFTVVHENSNVYLGIRDDGILVSINFLRLNNDETVNLMAIRIKYLQTFINDYIVPYIDFAYNNDDFCIVSEFISVGTMRKALDDFFVFPRRAVLRYLRDILTGLSFLHQLEIIHYIIRPENIFLADDGTCKLANFGLTPEVFSLCHKKIKGYARYIAPESANGEWTTASDIYSIGILIIELITGKNPWSYFKGDDSILLLELISNNNHSVPEIPNDLDSDIADIVRSCINRDPNCRPTAEDLLIQINYNS